MNIQLRTTGDTEDVRDLQDAVAQSLVVAIAAQYRTTLDLWFPSLHAGGKACYNLRSQLLYAANHLSLLLSVPLLTHDTQ